jgi:serine/threonine-protein kinase
VRFGLAHSRGWRRVAGDVLPPAADRRPDTYALGLLLFEMLAGEPPFPVTSQKELALCHVRERPPDVRSFRSCVTLEVNELVCRMLAKDPLRRPTCPQLVNWLAELEIAELTVPHPQ